jgi:hypothetical protein
LNSLLVIKGVSTHRWFASKRNLLLGRILRCVMQRGRLCANFGHGYLRDSVVVLRRFALAHLGIVVRQEFVAPHWSLSRNTDVEFRNHDLHLQSPATTPTSAHFLLPLPPETENMSDGEIEVESPSGYAVLPKDVTDEIGSIKLFNKASSSRWLTCTQY